MRIGSKPVGRGEGVFIVAEMSANHRGSLDEALKIIFAAGECGADAVKVQTYTPDTLTIDCDSDYFRVAGGTPWDGKTLYELYREAFTPWEWYPRLGEAAEEAGVILFSTPFDATAVDFLEKNGAPAYKIASFEIVDLALIERAARTGKPLLISTGMASLGEIGEAVAAARGAGARDIILLRCASAYPADPADINLRSMVDMRERFGVEVGLSDHTLGIAVPVAAVALGACLLEKHFTLNRAAGGVDASFSLEPHEFREMASAVRTAESALGSVRYGVTAAEKKNLVFRRSLFVVRDVEAGEVFTERNVRSIRPGHGLPPKHLAAVLGKVAVRRIIAGTPLGWDMVGEETD